MQQNANTTPAADLTPAQRAVILGARVIRPGSNLARGTVVDRKRSLGADLVAVQWDGKYAHRWELASDLIVMRADHL